MGGHAARIPLKLFSIASTVAANIYIGQLAFCALTHTRNSYFKPTIYMDSGLLLDARRIFWGGLGPWGLEEAGPGEQGGTSTVLVVFAVIFVVGHCFTPLLFVIWISVKVPVLAIGTIYNIFHPIMYLSCMFHSGLHRISSHIAVVTPLLSL